MEVSTHPINSISINSAEDLAVTSSMDKKLRVFTLKDSNLRLQYELAGHESEVVKAIFVGGSDMIASADFAGNLFLWTLDNKKYALKQRIKVFEGAITSLTARLGRDVTVFCGCADGKIRAYKLTDTEYGATEIASNEYGVTCLSCNDEHLVSGGMDFKVNLYADSRLVETFADHENRVNDVAVCPSNKFGVFCFASCSDDKSVIIYTKESGGFKKQRIEIGEECYELCFSKTGFVLTVGYGKNSFKAFVPDENGNFTETEVEEIVN
ncbi:Vesicle coat complex COPII, subunit SEC13 [Trachipleistophora hominis]|uniref:Vesicle coat complex COPII, subunit SEC13 n=1 Tax=Trachipleistophora hominis TaxID=72359 RepID=L7JT49_TRAHO|nr:Vesicle coat complex COPII, subunit SEC13 [Trachipleistophora hominis]